MVQNVTSLLNTVREVENENTRGSRALESTVQAITQEIRVIKCKQIVNYGINLCLCPFSR